CINADTLRTDLLLCGKNEQLAPSLTLADIYDPPCSDSSLLAHNSGVEIFTAYKDSLDDSFNRKYNEKCLAAASVESFTVEHNVSEYHYTLYYYDQAGNLVKTIAPAGVNPNRNSTWLAQVAAKRLTGEKQVPNHIMPTVYRYNSLNQVVTQRTPDAGKSSNWYDRLGRLVVSQNAQQLIDGNYSYTLYDPLGRITEVGQKPQPTAMTQTISRSPSALETWVYDNDGSNTLGAEMVTQTTYDVPGEDATACVEALRFTQKPYTLRNRVSYTRYFEKPAYTYNGTRDRYEITGYSYTTGIDYSYDIHGNVDTMRNLYGTATYNPMPHHGNNACKTIAYTYDLISGKVNQVHYNPGQVDEFYHRYEYDAENRLLNVYVTDHKAFIGQDRLEENDASYKYYRHGPLARKVIGQEKVTGMDYAYTLQGWLKGINSTSSRPLNDIGADGVGGTGYPNQFVTRDFWGYTLNYYKNDYEPINSSVKPTFPEPNYKLEAPNQKPLYNGNIWSTIYNLPSRLQAFVWVYGYDQLNRLVNMDGYYGYSSTSNNFDNLVRKDIYKERYSYDGNGNIKTVLRNGSSEAYLSMDSLTYFYNANTNKLNYIRDRVFGSTSHTNTYGATTDVKDQAANNYTYDAIGNLKSSVWRGPSNINWNVYGKIEELTKPATSGTTAQLIHYYYDPSGNRTGQAMRMGASGANFNYIWYVKDAQGNTLATYTVT
ncbi:MAG: hypothetical protein KF690_12500, partial [Bacteroidetes bacterium]|nr:hypothetical protein [Bacteroidota bacterium]